MMCMKELMTFHAFIVLMKICKACKKVTWYEVGVFSFVLLLGFCFFIFNHVTHGGGNVRLNVHGNCTC